MPKLYFHYGAMNCGKSTALLQVAYNYEERGMKVLLVKPQVDTKGSHKVISRLGSSQEVDILLKPTDDLFQQVREIVSAGKTISCILIDEAQFLTPTQASEAIRITLELRIPVMAYGLRTDFQTKGFPGSSRLLEIADVIKEVRTICRCGKNATFNAREINGKFTSSGEQVAIDGEESVTYESMCGACYSKKVGKIN